MASKRAVKRKECARKVRHETLGAAYAAIRSGLRDGHEWSRELTPYRCRLCGGFHLGHRPGFYRENINKRAMRGEM